MDRVTGVPEYQINVSALHMQIALCIFMSKQQDVSV